MPGDGLAHMTRKPIILLVDDDTAIQRALGPLLAARGYDARMAPTGAEALRLFAEESPDLVVLDLGLPDLDGSEVCRRLRAGSKVPIVVLSARGSEAEKVRALDLGADDYVTKPFGPEELLARIRAALRRTGQLRKKIEPDPANPRYLLSEPWVGYRFSTGEPDTQA
ncbi:MAG: kdpE [Acidobacteria bacterium]|nr:kdpE [Acidobacteriota bacterium]